MWTHRKKEQKRKKSSNKDQEVRALNERQYSLETNIAYNGVNGGGLSIHGDYRMNTIGTYVSEHIYEDVY